MKTLNATVINKTTLRLEEKGEVGDIIDLESLTSVDISYINHLVDESKNKEIEKKLNEIKEQYESLIKEKERGFTNELNNKINEIKLDLTNKYTNEINSLNSELKTLKETKEKDLSLTRQEIISEKDKVIASLNNEIKSLKDNYSNDFKLKENEIENKYKDEIFNLKIANELIKKENETSLSNQKLELTESYNKEIEQLKNEKNEIQSKLSQLTLEKDSLNVKKLGEQLEKWCDEEMKNSMLSGFANSKWYKDNTTVRNEDETSGTKADYIFEIYSSNEMNTESLLTSVCLEMKNESNTSTNKKKNSDYFKKLNDDRTKKKCEYALLVSELEWNSNNDAPIKRVNEYEKMYVIRPQYMVSILGLIYSLYNKFSTILNEDNKEKLTLKSSYDLLEEFNKLKNTYLFKPLNALANNVEKLYKNNENILLAANNNRDVINEIIDKSIKEMQSKIDNFEIKIKRELKKHDKL